jgi:uncharacterized protein YaeQ
VARHREQAHTAAEPGAVFRVPTGASQALAKLAQRSMQLQATVQEGVLTLGDAANTVDIEPVRLK